MTTILVSMIVVLVISLGTVGLVLVGIRGRGKRHAPRFVNGVARAAQHLNGDAEPPKRLVRLIESARSR